MVTLTIFIVPPIYSVFSGQHSFSDDSNNCLKCHGDIKKELDSSSYHTSLSCGDCHVNSSGNSMHGNIINSRCIDCHSQVENEVNNNKESHKPFIQQANLNSLMKGDNEACISCHTTKSINFNILFADIYQLKSTRIGEGWQISDLSKNIIDSIPVSVDSNGTAGQHTFPSLSELKCEKCHERERVQLDNSNFHKDLSCESCHQLGKNGSGNVSDIYHIAEIPLCLNCHVYNSDIGKDAHTPFVSSAQNSGEVNSACSSCHSTFNNKITFTRPSYIEWDVRNDNGSWFVENLTIGTNKDIEINKNYSNGNLHDISLDGDCISCHKDINDAVTSGGHSYEGQVHNYNKYTDMNVYCISCHRPLTQDVLGTNIHGAIKISCIDCHTKSLSVDIMRNGNSEQPLYDSSKMGGIETSISGQPYFIQSYLCIVCKNIGNPSPVNGSSLHFKMLTEPNVDIYINDTKVR